MAAAYLQILGIAGKSTATGFTGWIEIQAWTSKRRDPNIDFTVLRDDVDFNLIQRHLAIGTVFKVSTIALVKDGVTYFRIVMKGNGLHEPPPELQ